jgi:hypothetical protein
MSGMPAAPSCVYNTSTELITGLTTAMEMSVDGGAYSPVTNATYDVSGLIDALTTDSIKIRVRVAASNTNPVGEIKVITVYPRLSSAPTSLSYDPVTISLLGTTTAMQYKAKTATSWTTAAATTTNLKSLVSATNDVIIDVRFKATTTNSASQSVEYTIPQLLPGPIGTIDYANELITGLENGVAYQYNTTTNPAVTATWTNATVVNGEMSISSFISTTAKIINIRKAETSVAPLTDYTTFSLPARVSAPSAPIFVYNDSSNYDMAVLTGIADTMEYKLSTETIWTSVSGTSAAFDIPTANLTYQVRFKATSGSFCSSVKSLTLSKAGNAPSSTYNTATKTLSGVSTAMEISVDDGAYFNSTGTTYNLTSILDMYAPGSIVTVNIRTRATTTAPASLVKTITITVV